MAGSPWKRLKREVVNAGLTGEYRRVCREVVEELRPLGLDKSLFDDEMRRLVVERMGPYFTGMGDGVDVAEADTPVVEAVDTGDGVAGDPVGDDVLDPSDDEVFSQITQRDIRWVWLNLGVKNPKGAPSRGAAYTLNQAHRNPRVFELIMRLVERSIPIPKVAESQARFEDDGRLALDAVDGLLGGSVR